MQMQKLPSSRISAAAATGRATIAAAAATIALSVRVRLLIGAHHYRLLLLLSVHALLVAVSIGTVRLLHHVRLMHVGRHAVLVTTTTTHVLPMIRGRRVHVMVADHGRAEETRRRAHRHAAGRRIGHERRAAVVAARRRRRRAVAVRLLH